MSVLHIGLCQAQKTKVKSNSSCKDFKRGHTAQLIPSKSNTMVCGNCYYFSEPKKTKQEYL